MNRIEKWVVRVILVVFGVGLIVALERPTVVNATFELVTGGASASALTSASPIQARVYHSARVMILLAVVVLAIGMIAWKTGTLNRIPRNILQGKICLVLAGLMVIIIINYLAPAAITLGIQATIVAGIVLIVLLIETRGRTGKRLLAVVLAICLIILGLDNLKRSGGPLKGMTLSSGLSASAAAAAGATSVGSGIPTTIEKKFEAPVGKWSPYQLVVKPNHYFICESDGEMDVQRYSDDKSFRHIPGMKHPYLKVETGADAMWRFQSATNKPVTVTFQYSPK
jgi:hypothetical protein